MRSLPVTMKKMCRFRGSRGISNTEVSKVSDQTKKREEGGTRFEELLAKGRGGGVKTEARVTCAVIRFGYVTRYYGRDGEWVPVDCWSKQEERGEAPIITLAWVGDKGRRKQVLLTGGDAKCGGIYDHVFCYMSPDGDLDHEQLRAIAKRLGYVSGYRDMRIHNSGRVQFLAALTSNASAVMPLSPYDHEERRLTNFKAEIVKKFGEDAAPMESRHDSVTFWVTLSELAGE